MLFSGLLDFIATCLQPEKKDLHSSALSAIIRMEPEQRLHYVSQLQRLASEPAEDEQVREWAGDILSGKR